MIIGETERVLAVKSFLVTVIFGLIFILIIYCLTKETPFCDAWQKVTKENSYLFQNLVITNINLTAMPEG